MRKRIGEFLIEKGVLTQTQVEEIVEHGTRSGLRFGEAGVDLGLLTQEKLIGVFGPSFAVDFFHVEAQYFPKITQDLLSVELMLKWGALPLGYKTERKLFSSRKSLNLGLLDPARGKEVTEEVLRSISAQGGREPVQEIKIFLILTEQFLEVLETVYSTGPAELSKYELKQVDGTLAMFLEHVT